MEGYSSRKEEGCPQLLDLIPREREWVVLRAEENTNHGLSEEQKLELRLGPPGGEDWSIMNPSSRISFGGFPNSPCPQSPWQKPPSFLQLHSAVMKEPSQTCHNRAAMDVERKPFSAAPANTAVVQNSAQKRTAPAPVVGWPPIRSFRKNLASGSSSKLASDSQNVVPNNDSSKKPVENGPKGLFVKINMDGIPIGRKVDLKAYDSYEKLACAVDELFRGLLAAQNDSCAGGTKDKEEGGKVIGGLLDGSGEYTLVYEDNEGDRVLVGDVPWPMFVSTVKRLRVLKSSELPTLSRGSKQGKLSLDA